MHKILASGRKNHFLKGHSSCTAGNAAGSGPAPIPKSQKRKFRSAGAGVSDPGMLYADSAVLKKIYIHYIAQTTLFK